MIVAARWTEQEIEYLSDHVGILGYAELARKMGRSESAIKLCRCRRGLPTFHNGDYYSCTMLAQELGRSRASIRKYYRKGWLVGKRATWIARFGKRPLVFVEKHIVAFLKKFNYLFDWKKIPNLYFRNVVKGVQNG